MFHRFLLLLSLHHLLMLENSTEKKLKINNYLNKLFIQHTYLMIIYWMGIENKIYQNS